MTIAPQLRVDGLDDAALVHAAAGGDRAAFAAIYDRYADRLHDFCIGMLRDREAAADCVQDVFVIAATKLGQLREADRLRPWLYAIARSEALARIRHRRREQVSEDLPEMASNDPDLATLAARCELADLIAEASGGLSDRDRTVLELAYRQGLDGPELAAALGVTRKAANTLVERLRETIARSLGALLVSRHVKADPSRCPQLAALMDESDGEFTVLMRKRIARHIDICEVCESQRARMVTPTALLGAAPVVIPAPAWLRDQTLNQVRLGGPPPAPGPTAPHEQARQVTKALGDASGSCWPPSDFDDHIDVVPADAHAAIHTLERHKALAAPPRHQSRQRRKVLGAGLVLVGVGGALVLAKPATVEIVPAVDEPALAPTSQTTTTVTAPPSSAFAPAPQPAPSIDAPVTNEPVVTTYAPGTQTDTPTADASPAETTRAPATTGTHSATTAHPTTKPSRINGSATNPPGQPTGGGSAAPSKPKVPKADVPAPGKQDPGSPGGIGIG